MLIKEILTHIDSNVNDLVGLLHQQMIDIGSPKSKDESRAMFFVLYDDDKAVGMANYRANPDSTTDWTGLRQEIHGRYVSA